MRIPYKKAIGRELLKICMTENIKSTEPNKKTLNLK